jgi:hypothetical protein
LLWVFLGLGDRPCEAAKSETEISCGGQNGWLWQAYFAPMDVETRHLRALVALAEAAVAALATG